MQWLWRIIVYYCHAPSAGKPGDVARIDKVKITPDYPVKDKPITLDATFTILSKYTAVTRLDLTSSIYIRSRSCSYRVEVYLFIKVKAVAS